MRVKTLTSCRALRLQSTPTPTFAKLELNPPHAYAAIILDVDNPSDAGWPSGTPTPVPSWLVLNTRARTPTRRPGGLHVVYALEVPIARLNAAHTAPLSFLAHVADRLSHHLGADSGYTGLITRNPINPGPECFTHWGRMFPYTLGELAPAATQGYPAVQTPNRNRPELSTYSGPWSPKYSVHDGHPSWGAQGWSEAWLVHVRGQNVAMFAPEGLLPETECRSIAKSVFPATGPSNTTQGRFQCPTAGQERAPLA